MSMYGLLEQQTGPPRRVAVDFLLILSLGVLLRLYHIGYNLDGDEIVSVEFAKGTVSQLIHYSIVDRVHPPEYYLLLWLWIKILGNSETAVRLLSVLLGTIFLALLFGVMRRFATATMALFAILICAVSPFFVLYGGQVRPYSLIACLSLLSLYLLLRHREYPHAKRWGILYGLS